MRWRRAATQDSDHNQRGYLQADVVGRDGPSAPSVDPSPTAPTGVGDRLRKVQEALVALRAAHPSGVFSAARTVDSLLDVWSLAAAVDRSAARPIEALLVALVDRDVVTAEELAVCADDVEFILAWLSG